MNKLLIPLLVVHYATLVHERVLMTFDDYHFIPLCFALLSAALAVTVAAFCTLGWAYVRFLRGDKGAPDPAA
ncbi:hypothetical protein GKC30_06525 [Pseudodesulfovibrio sp. F-1]|uniref:Uncharacterized protein n=1 Tax=Pseudodesulfovibrio alkaliphilus TaxID=2661613 RepID=A0A7K1KN28_9BACT|nr:hypothetical protein [Pseudodesulfovibrio alkaliphilus]MUM77282.1 hypothetical protein [Pseudodesulfovibrio alkaliphilus]